MRRVSPAQQTTVMVAGAQLWTTASVRLDRQSRTVGELGTCARRDNDGKTNDAAEQGVARGGELPAENGHDTHRERGVREGRRGVSSPVENQANCRWRTCQR
jgi:hypothetical protein